jgi:hypothetical protein
MKIIQVRYLFGDDFTLSNLYDGDSILQDCPYILEDKAREVRGAPVHTWKIPKETAIPVGIYTLEKTWSGRWKKLMWELVGVDGFGGIRIHSGNTSHDTEGCMITGSHADEDHGEVTSSRVACDALDKVLDAAKARGEVITWEVRGLPDDPVSAL